MNTKNYNLWDHFKELKTKCMYNNENSGKMTWNRKCFGEKEIYGIKFKWSQMKICYRDEFCP